MKRVALIIIAACLCLAAPLNAQQSAGETKAAQKAKKLLLEEGAKLYTKYACNSCHGNDGIAQGDLRQAYRKYTDDQLKNYIRNPRGYSNMKMPVYKEVIPDADYKALLAYVRNLGEKANASSKKK